MQETKMITMTKLNILFLEDPKIKQKEMQTGNHKRMSYITKLEKQQ